MLLSIGIVSMNPHESSMFIANILGVKDNVNAVIFASIALIIVLLLVVNYNNQKPINDNETYSEYNKEGFIILDCKENQKSHFIDILNGFEEYTQLKGYKVNVSVDQSIRNKIAFKFNLIDSGIDISSNIIRKDINDYIKRVRKGGDFEDIPSIISTIEHDILITTLKNRMSFLEHNYKLKDNALKHYEKLFDRFDKIDYFKGLSSAPTIFIQKGETFNSMIDSQNSFSEDTNVSIKISNSFNKRKEQIDKLDELIKLIKTENNRAKNEDSGIDFKKEVIKNLNAIKNELSAADKPNENLIIQNLKNTKKLMSGLVLTHKTSKAISWLEDSFQFIINSSIF